MIAAQPILSVITVVYNNVSDIERTILSVLGQTYQNIEYIVIDGLSNDGTLDVVHRYDSRIARIVSEKDKGIYDAMNKGLAIATGDYVLFMNSGDEFFDMDTVTAVFASADDADIYYGETEMITAGGQSLGQRRHKAPAKFTWRNFKYGMSISHQAIYIKSVVNVNRYVAKYLVGGMSKTKHRQSLTERFNIMKEHYGLLPTVFNHLIIAFNLGWYWLKNKKTND
jgi:glycosyltransferase involved in cell wall biosynthesis